MDRPSFPGRKGSTRRLSSVNAVIEGSESSLADPINLTISSENNSVLPQTTTTDTTTIHRIDPSEKNHSEIRNEVLSFTNPTINDGSISSKTKDEDDEFSHFPPDVVSMQTNPMLKKKKELQGRSQSNENMDSQDFLDAKKSLDDKQKERERFLSEMDNFSSNFEDNLALVEDSKLVVGSNEDIFIKNLQDTVHKFSAPLPEVKVNDFDSKENFVNNNNRSNIFEEEVKDVDVRVRKPATFSSTEKDNNTPIDDLINSLLVTPKKGVSTMFDTPAVEDTIQKKKSVLRRRSSLLNETATGSASPPDEDYAFLSTSEVSNTKTSTIFINPLLSSQKVTYSNYNNSNSSRNSTPSILSYQENAEEDFELEGTGSMKSLSNILTLEERKTMSVTQKSAWRAKYADLQSQRADFNGSLTYLFDGVFSWQMYGTSDAIGSQYIYLYLLITIIYNVLLMTIHLYLFVNY